MLPTPGATAPSRAWRAAPAHAARRSRCSSITSSGARFMKSALPSLPSILPSSPFNLVISLARRARSAAKSMMPSSGSAAVLPRTGTCTDCRWRLGGERDRRQPREAAHRVAPAVRAPARRRIGADEDKRDQGAERDAHLAAHRADFGNEVDHPADLGLSVAVLEAGEVAPSCQRQHAGSCGSLRAFDRPQLLGEERHERVQQLENFVEHEGEGCLRLGLLGRHRRHPGAAAWRVRRTSRRRCSTRSGRPRRPRR